MLFISPKQVVIEAVLDHVVGFEAGGIRVLDARFGPAPAEYFDDDTLVVRLTLTDPPGDKGWPRPARRAIDRHVRETAAATGAETSVIVQAGSQRDRIRHERASQ